MNAKEGLALFLGAGIVAAALTTACDNDPKQTEPSHIPTIATKTFGAEISWNSLSALERINQIELGNLPKIENLNDLIEITRATSQFYCENFPSAVSAEDLTSRVRFLSKEEFLNEAMKALGRSFVDNREREFFASKPEFVSFLRSEKAEIFINLDRVKVDVEKMRRVQPDLERKLKNHSLYYVTLRQILFHAYSHLNSSQEQMPINNISYNNFDVSLIDDFLLVGKNKQDGKNYTVSSGAYEAMTEYVALRMSLRLGAWVDTATYSDGAFTIGQINQKAEIADNEFFAYYRGNRPLKELFERWRSINDTDQSLRQMRGLRIFLMLGIAVDNPRQAQEQLGKIQELIK